MLQEINANHIASRKLFPQKHTESQPLAEELKRAQEELVEAL